MAHFASAFLLRLSEFREFMLELASESSQLRLPQQREGRMPRFESTEYA
jgi:hypothetical protein